MRGSDYATVRRARCPEFHQCVICGGCQQFNRHRQQCTLCEARKNVGSQCRHTDEQQQNWVRMTELTRMPMAHPDAAPQKIDILAAGNPEWERVLSGIHSDLGRITPIKESE